MNLLASTNALNFLFVSILLFGCSRKEPREQIPDGFIGRWAKIKAYKGHYSDDYRILIKRMDQNIIVVYHNAPYQGLYIGEKLFFARKEALYINEKEGTPDKLIVLGEAEYARVK